MVNTKRLLTGLTALVTLCHIAPANALDANALPTGGVVKGGSITFDNPNQMTQTSAQGVVNFDSFNIGRNQTYNVNNGSGATLIRDKQSQRTEIEGGLNATGKVMLVNGNGVFFGPRAVVNVGSIVATTSDIDNDRFMTGDFTFDKSKNTAANIENRGSIIAGEDGIVALVANGKVINKGLIVTNGGKVHLAAADRFTVDFDGDGIVNFQVSKKMEQALSGDKAEVNNSGIIYAHGGTIAMTASTAKSVVDGVINTSGIVVASKAGKRNGKIILSGSGEANLGGLMDAETADLDIKIGKNKANLTGEIADNVNVKSDNARIADGIDLVRKKGTVTVAKGNYVQEDTLNIDKSITLKGAGKNRTVINSRYNKGDGINVTADNVTLSDFTLEGGFNGITVADNSVAPKRAAAKKPAGSQYGVKNVTIDNVKVEGALYDQIILDGVNGALIQDVTLNGGSDWGWSGSNGSAIYVLGSKNVVIDGVKTDGNNYAGIDISQGCYCDSKDTSVAVYNTAGIKEQVALRVFDNQEADLTLYAPEYGFAMRNGGISGPENWGYSTVYFQGEKKAVNFANLMDDYMPRPYSTIQTVSHNADAKVSTPDADNFIVGKGMAIDPALYHIAEGGIINIRKGTYFGGFTIGKAVSLVGAGEDQTIIKGNAPYRRYGAESDFSPFSIRVNPVITVDAGSDDEVNLAGLTIKGAKGYGKDKAGLAIESGDVLTQNVVLQGNGKGNGITLNAFNGKLTTFDTVIRNYKTGLRVVANYKTNYDETRLAKAKKVKKPTEDTITTALLGLGTVFEDNGLDIHMNAAGYITDARLATFADTANNGADRVIEKDGTILLPEIVTPVPPGTTPGGPGDTGITQSQRVNRFLALLREVSGDLGAQIDVMGLIEPAAGPDSGKDMDEMAELNRRLAIILQYYLDTGNIGNAEDALRGLLLDTINT